MDELTRLPIPLLQWYHENARTLPWRSDPTPYHVWVSEIMLQQTRVAAVLEYYRRFMEALPTVADLAAVEEDKLLKLWQGLGYYNRARNLQKAARQVVEDFGGTFPGDYETLLGLSGVGEYTAGAIASIAFGQPVPAVDGNVLRVVSRLTGDGSDITKPETKKRMWADLKAVIPVRSPGDFNQAMMDLGATVCLPNGAPLCEKCPAADFCRARLEGRTGELPYKPPKKARRVEDRVVFLLFHEGKVALRQRPKKGLLGALGVPQRARPGPGLPGGLGHPAPEPHRRRHRQAHLYPHRVAHDLSGRGDRRYNSAGGLGVGRAGGAAAGLRRAQRLSEFSTPCGRTSALI